MSKTSAAQTDFTGGEFSSFVDARVDADRYKAGLYLSTNYYPLIQGPLVRRPGSRYVANAKFADQTARLIPFIFSTTDAFQIEFGDLYNRFYVNHGLLLETSHTLVQVSSYNPLTFTDNAHGYANGDRIYVQEVDVAITISGLLNNREFIVANATANTYEVHDINGNAIDYSAFNPGSAFIFHVARIYEIVSQYTEAQLPQIRVTQSADVLYVLHPDHPPRKLIRSDATNWDYVDIDFINGPYLPLNTTNTTLTPSGTTGSVTLTASNVVGINRDTGFQTTDVGRLIRLKDSAGNWTWGEITAWTSVLIVTFNIRGPDFADTSAILFWRLGVWSATSGYPRVGTFHEDRLWLGGAFSTPQRIDGSRTGDYENFTPTETDGTVADDHAVAATLNSNDVNAIFWLRSDEKGLVIGTKASEWIVRASSLDEPITPTSIQARPTTRWGSADAEAVLVGKSVLFVHKAKRKIRELTYFYDTGGYQAPDLCVLAEHLTVGGVEEIAFQQDPHSILWARRADGTLLGCTYQREGDTIRAGWHKHPMGGAFVIPGGNFFGDPIYAKAESISVIPAPDGLRDELWVINQRVDMNGDEIRTVEFFEKIFDDEDEQADAYFMDMGQSVVIEGGSEGGATLITSKVRGLYYLEGATIQTWVSGTVTDPLTSETTVLLGSPGPDLVVTNGSVILPDDFKMVASETNPVMVSYGLKYTSEGAKLRIEAGAGDQGPAIGKLRRIDNASFYFYRTMGIEVGNLEVNLYDELVFRPSTDDLDPVTPVLFTGIHHVNLPSDSNYDGRIAWRQTIQTPGTILAVTAFITTQDGG